MRRLNHQTAQDIKEKYIGINDPDAGGGMLYRAYEMFGFF